MTTEKRNSHVYDLQEMYSLIRNLAKDNQSKTSAPIGGTIRKSVDEEIAEYDREIDERASGFNKYIRPESTLGIVLLFIFSCIHFLFKGAFNLGYWLASFICQRRIVRFTFGMLFGTVSNMILLMIIYGIYMLYHYMSVYYTSGNEAAKLQSKEDLDVALQVVKKVTLLLKYLGEVSPELKNTTTSVTTELNSLTDVYN